VPESTDAAVTRPKVLCVGFHKTGTSSLGAALDRLGYRVGGPFGIRDPDIGERALDLALTRLDRFDAVRDNPWPLLFRELDERVPAGRFVLTVRAEDAWWASVVAHFGGTTTPMRQWIYGAGDPLGHEARYRERYRRHNEAVRDHFASRPADLLVLHLDRGDGWAQLCPFLGVDEPASTFPHANLGTPTRRVVNRLRGRVRGRARR
jgi:hypothetical protein